MISHVNSIAGRLSLRAPQRRSLEILDRITEIVQPQKERDLQSAIDTIRSEFSTVSDFERDFPSLCFAIATGVGKTRLMGAFISYLHLAHGINNYFVLAPNLTIYNKLIADFTPNTPKYVFKGIAEFAMEVPVIVTGDNYESGTGVRTNLLPGYETEVHINIFNISKINSEVRGGKMPRIKRLSEYIGESYFEYLSGLHDLVLIMDESHRYRASAGIRAINELKPVLGLELTATPFVETSKGAIPFKNVIFDYPLARAMDDGFVKEPAVVTQKNFDASQFSKEQLEEIKLKDGIRLHENTKVELETYSMQTGQKHVKPFMLIIARDTTHAGQLMSLIKSDSFFEGQYKDKVIQVDSSMTGVHEDEMIIRLLDVENPNEPTEIVIHVNMLKEGWDVTNLYTIVPLRAANARILIEQSIGRGLRLPYGKRTGESVIDRLSIVAHDRFQEIIDEANRPESVIRLKQVILDAETDLQKTRTVIVQSMLSDQISAPYSKSVLSGAAGVATEPIFKNETEQKIAQATLEIVKNNYESSPSSKHLLTNEVQSKIAKEVATLLGPFQQTLPGVAEMPNVLDIVAKTTNLMVQQTIDIPRILVLPKGEVTIGFNQFKLDVSNVKYQPVERSLLIQYLRTQTLETLDSGDNSTKEKRLEDYLIKELMDFDDISYDDHKDQLYDLAGQMVSHLQSYLPDDEAVRSVLMYHQKQLSALIHVQMQEHQWEKATDYEVKVSKGFTELKKSAVTVSENDPVANFRMPVQEKSKIAQMLFGCFQRCLYTVQKFQSDTERRLSVILDRDSLKWFRPAKGQFQIFYKAGVDNLEYVPDFIAETDDSIFMIETKAKNEMESTDVLSKKTAAVEWCAHASKYTQENGGKPWKYLLIPHDNVSENMTLPGLSSLFGSGS